jgi:type IV pilus assembly protein PilC
MKPFRAKYITPLGRTKRSRIWADDHRAAHAALRAQGNYPILLIEETVPSDGLRRYRTRLKTKDVIAILDQLEMQLDAEIPIDEALRNLAHEFPDGKTRFVVSRILERVATNGRVAEAFGQFPAIFPAHVVHMIDVGCQTGNLTKAFGRVVRHLNAADEIRGVVRKAVSYPIVSFLVVSCVAVFLLGFVLPMFGKVFAELNVPLPSLTRTYLQLSAFVRAHLVSLIAAFIALPVAVWQLAKLRSVREVIDQMLVRLPFSRNIVQYVVIARLSGNLGALYDAEIPMQDAVKLCGGISGNHVYDAAMQRAYERIGAGAGLGDALSGSRWFPSMVAHTLKVGERSGNLGKALDKLFQYYSRRSSEAVTTALQFLEPTLTIGLGLFVGSIAVSLIYPLGTLAMRLK